MAGVHEDGDDALPFPSPGGDASSVVVLVASGVELFGVVASGDDPFELGVAGADEPEVFADVEAGVVVVLALSGVDLVVVSAGEFAFGVVAAFGAEGAGDEEPGVVVGVAVGAAAF